MSADPSPDEAGPGDRALAELEDLLGRGGVLTDATDLARHTQPFRGEGGPTAAVVRPASVHQVRDLVGWARRHRIRLLPQGANTGLVGASTPPPDGVTAVVVVSLELLDGDPVIDPVDRTAVVRAGTRLSRLNDAAAAHGLTFPIDLGADPSLGGMVATNTGGARMLRHGDVRRHLLGVRAVVADADCTVVDELTTLRKHNLGPSLSHWFVGSSGAFGIVTDVAVELARIPTTRACAWIVPSSEEQVFEALLFLEEHHGGWLEAFEVVSAEALDAALAHGSPVHPFGDRPSPPLSILVELAGTSGVATADEAEDRLVAALAALTERGAVLDGAVLPAEKAWAPRHAVSEGLRQLGTVLGFDVSVPRPSLPAFLRAVRRQVGAVAPQVTVADFGHWGDGGVHCNLVVPDADLDAALAERLREVVLGTAVRDFGGSFSAEHGIGPGNAQWWRATVEPGVRELFAGIKEVLDPLGILGHPGLPYGRDDSSSSSAPSSSAGSGRDMR